MYAFDPHCTNQANRFEFTVKGSQLDSRHKLKVFPYPVYFKTLRVSKAGKQLVLGKDYFVGLRYLIGTSKTAQTLVGGIYSLDLGTNESATITGHYLGGQFGASDAQINSYLTTKYDAPDTDHYEKIIGDVFFPPVNIKFDIEAWNGEAELMACLDRLARDIRNKPATEGDHYKVALDYVEDLEAIINDSKWFDHLTDYNNSHKTKAYQIGALRSDEVAQNATLAFSKDIDELLRYIKDRAPNLATLSQYLKDAVENRVSGDIILTDEKSTIRGVSPSTNMQIDLSAGTAKFTSNRNVTIQADANKVGGFELVIHAGKNEIKIISSGTGKDNSALLYNGQVLMTVDNVNENLPDVSIGDFIIHHSTDGNIRFRGKGIRGSELMGDVTIVHATKDQPGAVKITNDKNVNVLDVVATPKLVKELGDDANGLVPNTRTINDQAMQYGVTITKASIGLGLTDNTSDLEKPISSYGKASLDEKSPTNHTHDIDDFDIPIATDTTYGVAKTAVDYDPNGISAASPKIVKSLTAKLSNNETNLVKYIPSGVMYVKSAYVRGGDVSVDGVGTVTYTQSIAIKLMCKSWRLDRLSYETKGIGNGEACYVYARVVDDQLETFMTSDGSYGARDDYIELGRIYKRPNGAVISHTFRKLQLSFGKNESLKAHEASTSAHGIYGLDKTSLNLNNMRNYPLAKYAGDSSADKYASVATVKSFAPASSEVKLDPYVKDVTKVTIPLPDHPDSDGMFHIELPLTLKEDSMYNVIPTLTKIGSFSKYILSVTTKPGKSSSTKVIVVNVTYDGTIKFGGINTNLEAIVFYTKGGLA